MLENRQRQLKKWRCVSRPRSEKFRGRKKGFEAETPLMIGPLQKYERTPFCLPQTSFVRRANVHVQIITLNYVSVILEYRYSAYKLQR